MSLDDRPSDGRLLKDRGFEYRPDRDGTVSGSTTPNAKRSSNFPQRSSTISSSFLPVRLASSLALLSMVPLQSAPPSVPGAVIVADGSICGPLSELLAGKDRR